MTLVKTSLLAGLSTGIKVLTGLVSLKITAIYLGPTCVVFFPLNRHYRGYPPSIAVNLDPRLSKLFSFHSFDRYLTVFYGVKFITPGCVKWF